MDFQTHNQFKLRLACLQAFNAHLLSVLHVTGHHAQLIGKGEFRCIAIIGSNAGKGVLLMAHGLIEAFAHILDKVHDTPAGDFRCQWQGVHKHAKGVLDADVGTAAADGADIQVVIAGEAGKDQQRGSQRQMGGCHRMLAAELLHSL